MRRLTFFLREKESKQRKTWYVTNCFGILSLVLIRNYNFRYHFFRQNPMLQKALHDLGV